VRAPYFQPRLTLDNVESEMEADLLIYSSARLESIRVETYLAIVRALYYGYYLPWKSYVPQSNTLYEQHLDRIYTTIQSRLGRSLVVLINGHNCVPSDECGICHRVWACNCLVYRSSGDRLEERT
jgi:hypothetical protein